MSKDEYLITDAPLKALTVFAMHGTSARKKEEDRGLPPLCRIAPLFFPDRAILDNIPVFAQIVKA